MMHRKYSVAIDFTKTPDVVFSHIIALTKWWPEEFAGKPIGLNSAFEFRIGDEHYSKNKVTEFVPGKKLVWLTLQSSRRQDSFDWTGTKMIFELAAKGSGTELIFTYDGVVMENEYDRLIQICDLCIKDRLYNFIESITTTIKAARPAKDIFNIITADVPKWWGGKDLTGNHINPGDEFIVNHPGAHRSKQKVIEVIPGKKVIWLVTESELDWLKDKEEWTGTKMIFELAANGDKTTLGFTHYGLTSEKECYDRCNQGWHTVIEDYLFNLITHGKIAEQLYR